MTALGTAWWPGSILKYLFLASSVMFSQCEITVRSDEQAGDAIASVACVRKYTTDYSGVIPDSRSIQSPIGESMWDGIGSIDSP